MDLPGWLLRHTVSVKTRTGSGPYGDVYAAPVTVACLVEDKTRFVRDPGTGQQVISSARLYGRLDVAALFPPGSLVTVSGRETTVISTDVNDGGGLPTPDHVAVSLA
jgi:hypothetical protein